MVQLPNLIHYLLILTTFTLRGSFIFKFLRYPVLCADYSLVILHVFVCVLAPVGDMEICGWQCSPAGSVDVGSRPGFIARCCSFQLCDLGHAS